MPCGQRTSLLKGQVGWHNAIREMNAEADAPEAAQLVIDNTANEVASKLNWSKTTGYSPRRQAGGYQGEPI